MQYIAYFVVFILSYTYICIEICTILHYGHRKKNKRQTYGS